MQSIFNLLDDANKTWSIYWDGHFSTAYAIEPLQPYADTNNFPLEIFASDVTSMGTNLPQYVFITPSLKGYQACGGRCRRQVEPRRCTPRRPRHRWPTARR